MVFRLTSRYKHILRYREIANVLTRHGFGFLLDQAGILSGFKVPWRKKDRRDQEKLSTAQRIRRVLEELGPTFIKLGQLMSTRPDLFPPDVIDELEHLQDRVQPVSFGEIKTIIEEELGAPVEELFAEVDPAPLATASIGQVHRGRLAAGEEVVLKVQRQGVDRLIETDLEIMFDIARLLEWRTSWGRFYKLGEMVEEFARAIRQEVDYTYEGRNADRFRENFAGVKDVVSPKVYWPFTTRRVLVLEYVEGIKITALDELRAAGYNLTTVAKKVANAVFKQILVDGFFHGDPHPGNIAVLAEESIFFMDFGMVGRLDEYLRDRFAAMLLNIVRRDIDGIVRVLLEIGKAHGKVSKQNLRRDISYLFVKYYDRPLKEIRVGEALRELLGMSYVYRIRIPSEVVLLTRTLILLEGAIEKLDPGLSIVDLAEPFGKKLLYEKMAPGRLAKKALAYGLDIAAIGRDLPRRADNLLHLVEAGEIGFKIELKNFVQFVNRLNIVSNRLSFSVIIAAIIIGSSLMAQRSESVLIRRYPVAEIGFVVAVLLGMWLLISIIRSGRI